MADARRLFNQLYGIPLYARHNPCVLPVSLGREDVVHLERGYVVAPKTDGKRMSLVLGATEAEDVPYAALVDRSGGIVPLAVAGSRALTDAAVGEDADLFEGTLLDCERVGASLVLLDAVAVAGYSLADTEDFRVRLRLAAAAAECVDLRDGTTPLRFRTKEFVPVAALATVDYAAGADGLIFMPRMKPVQRGRSATLFKWKPQHTFDALWRKGQFWLGDDAALVPACELLPNIAPRDDLCEDVVYELFPRATGGWTVGDVRTDKGTTPNQASTVRATLAHRGLTHADLLSALSNKPRAQEEKRG